MDSEGKTNQDLNHSWGWLPSPTGKSQGLMTAASGPKTQSCGLEARGSLGPQALQVGGTWGLPKGPPTPGLMISCPWAGPFNGRPLLSQSHPQDRSRSSRPWPPYPSRQTPRRQLEGSMNRRLWAASEEMRSHPGWPWGRSVCQRERERDTPTHSIQVCVCAASCVRA